MLELSAVAGQRLRNVCSHDVLGPVDCAIERLSGLWRRHILLKLPLDHDVTFVESALADLDQGKSRMIIDVDPYSLS